MSIMKSHDQKSSWKIITKKHQTSTSKIIFKSHDKQKTTAIQQFNCNRHFPLNVLQVASFRSLLDQSQAALTKQQSRPKWIRPARFTFVRSTCVSLRFAVRFVAFFFAFPPGIQMLVCLNFAFTVGRKKQSQKIHVTWLYINVCKQNIIQMLVCLNFAFTIGQKNNHKKHMTTSMSAYKASYKRLSVSILLLPSAEKNNHKRHMNTSYCINVSQCLYVRQHTNTSLSFCFFCGLSFKYLAFQMRFCAFSYGRVSARHAF